MWIHMRLWIHMWLCMEFQVPCTARLYFKFVQNIQFSTRPIMDYESFNHTTKITIQDFLISVGFIRSKRRNMWNVGSVSGEFKLYFIIIFLCIIKWVSMCNPLEPGYKCSCSLMTIHISQILKIAEETKWRTTTEYQKFVPRSSASIQAATYAELLKRQLLLWTAREIVCLKKKDISELWLCL